MLSLYLCSIMVRFCDYIATFMENKNSKHETLQLNQCDIVGVKHQIICGLQFADSIDDVIFLYFLIIAQYINAFLRRTSKIKIIEGPGEHMLEDVVTVILAGRKGKSLFPLTKDRPVPAVPFGGKYRSIDFTLANCLHSGLRRILVLTQYKSLSLQKHIRDGWSIFNPELGEYITTVPPQMRTGDSWYKGTADAIYQNLYLLERSDAKWILVLSGDHIHRMDYAPLIRSHVENGSELTIVCREVPFEVAGQYDVVKSDMLGRVTNYVEKCKSIKTEPVGMNSVNVSTGVYLFSIKALLDVLNQNSDDSQSDQNISHDVIPKLVRNNKVSAYHFGGKFGRVTPDGYWRELDSLDSYFEANMDLLKHDPPINLYQSDWQIRTYQEQLPPCRTVPGDDGTEGIFINSIASSGVVISGGTIQHSILFSNVFIDDEASIENSLILNNVKVGKGVILKNCIIDKDVVIPEGEWIGVDREKDKERFTISAKGIVVVPKGYKFENQC